MPGEGTDWRSAGSILAGASGSGLQCSRNVQALQLALRFVLIPIISRKELGLDDPFLLYSPTISSDPSGTSLSQYYPIIQRKFCKTFNSER
jgi:hypothetical protein